MKRLTDESYWDSVHGYGAPIETPPTPAPPFRRWLLHIGRSYADEHFWRRLHCHLKSGPLKAIEIGSAPGTFLRECHARFGFDPYGVEYSAVGAKVNRENFKSWGFDPDHVIESDLFADVFQSQYRAQFDVVISRGFIEHFTSLQPVIDAHANLLRPGGTLVISIPNFRGINYALGLLTVRELYPLHNLGLMRRDEFGKLFARPDLETLFCGYEGGVDLGIIEGGADTAFTRRVLAITRRVQWGLNVVFNSLFFGHVPETRYSSPNPLYIGRKKPPC
jgi:SAM-dependent methyltransferase